MSLKCAECNCDLTSDNSFLFKKSNEEVIRVCKKDLDKLMGNGHVDEDGNITSGDLHIYRGTNRDEGVWNYPCPNCGSLTYLGVFIPTVAWFSADYLGTSYRCHNEACDPLYEESEIDWDENGDECEPFTVYDLIDYGAYWADEDKFYYTPQSPRE